MANPEPKFQIGDYVFASDDPLCGQGHVRNISYCHSDNDWQYSIIVPGNERADVRWSERYLTFIHRTSIMDVAADEYDEIMVAQELISDV